MAKAELKGLNEVTTNINNIINGMLEDVTEELYNIGLDVGMLAQQKAPIESGDLRDSMNVIKEGANRVLVSFGGPLTTRDGYDYAVRQHEDLELRHDRTDGYMRKDGTSVNLVAGGEAKFLERAFKEIEPKALKTLASVAKRRL